MTQPPETPDDPPDFLAEPVPPAGEHPPVPPGYGYAPYAHPFAQPHGGATTGLVLGIISVVCALLAPVTCFSIVGALAGPFAVFLGARARKEMEQAPGRYNNPGIATAAFVTGLVGSVLGILMLGLVVLVFGLFVSVAGP